MPEAIPIVDIRAETVADAFFSGWIARYGTPATITTDRGAQFESKLWDNLCNQFGIIRNRTTSYHPQSNGMVERFHRQLKAAIMAQESPSPWTITLPAVLLGRGLELHRETGISHGSDGLVGDRQGVIHEDQGDQRGPMQTARTFEIRTVNMVSH